METLIWLLKALSALLRFRGRVSVLQAHRAAQWWEITIMKALITSATANTFEMRQHVRDFGADLFWGILMDRPRELWCDYNPSGILNDLAGKHKIPIWTFPYKTVMKLSRAEVTLVTEMPPSKIAIA